MKSPAEKVTASTDNNRLTHDSSYEALLNEIDNGHAGAQQRQFAAPR
jgi:hypothetical protein